MAERNQNDELLDEQLVQAILVLAAAEKLGREAINTLNDTEPKIAALIRGTKTGLRSAADVRRLNKLLGEIRVVRGRAWRAIERGVMVELKKLAKQQPKKMREIVNDIFGRTGLELPSDSALNALVEKGELQGRTIPDWIEKQRADDDARIGNQVRFGFMAMERPERIVRRVFGEARVLGANGATEEARRRLFEIVVLSGLFVGNESKRAFVGLNGNTFDRELYLAILDNRTTQICRSLNRRVFRVGEGPYPPLHFWCRSIRIFLMPGALPAEITSLKAWLDAQPSELRRTLNEARAARFKRS